MIRQDYIDRLKQGVNEVPISKINYINPCIKGVLFEDIIMVEFYSLYPTLLSDLFDYGMIDKTWKDDIDKVKWFIKNRSTMDKYSDEYKRSKSHCNTLYSKIRTPYVVEYLSIFYHEIIKNYGDKILYINIDMMFINCSKADLQIPELNDFRHEVTSIRYFYTERIHKYFFQSEEGEILNKRISDDVIRKLKSEIREKKLDKLGMLDRYIA